MCRQKTCAKPACSGASLRQIEVESSWTIEKYYCTNCGHIYIVPTSVGKAVQVAPLVTTGLLLTALLSGGDTEIPDDFV